MFIPYIFKDGNQCHRPGLLLTQMSGSESYGLGTFLSLHQHCCLALWEDITKSCCLLSLVRWDRVAVEFT